MFGVIHLTLEWCRGMCVERDFAVQRGFKARRAQRTSSTASSSPPPFEWFFSQSLLKGMVWGCIARERSSSPPFERVFSQRLLNGMAWGCVARERPSSPPFERFFSQRLCHAAVWGCVAGQRFKFHSVLFDMVPRRPLVEIPLGSGVQRRRIVLRRWREFLVNATHVLLGYDARRFRALARGSAWCGAVLRRRPASAPGAAAVVRVDRVGVRSASLAVDAARGSPGAARRLGRVVVEAAHSTVQQFLRRFQLTAPALSLEFGPRRQGRVRRTAMGLRVLPSRSQFPCSVHGVLSAAGPIRGTDLRSILVFHVAVFGIHYRHHGLKKIFKNRQAAD